MSALGAQNQEKLVQVTFDTKPIIHVPIIVGNECYVISQQDVRRVEDMRYITYSKMAANGELIPIENNAMEKARFNAVDDRLLQMLQQARVAQQAPPPEITHIPLYNRTVENYPCPMEVSQTNMPQTILPTVEQQLHWQKSSLPNVAFPLHHTVATNTDSSDCKKCGCLSKTFSDCGINCILTNQLGAREQIKKRKSIRFVLDD